MENYEDDYYFEEKDFQDCKSNLFLSGKLGKVTEVEEKTINLLSNPINSQEVHICKNELHLQKPTFPSKQILQAHVIRQHKCPFIRCAFYNMYEATINTHYQNSHIKEKTLRNKCDICQILVKDVIEHKKNIHPRCVSCRQYFLSLSILRKHELECASLEVVELDEMAWSTIGNI